MTFDFVTLTLFIIGKGYILELYNIIILYNLYYTQGLLLTDMRECLMGRWDNGTMGRLPSIIWKVLNVTKSKVTMSIPTPMSPKAAKRES